MRDPVLFARALADPCRWRIVHLVSNRALCVCELAGILRLPQSTLSSHLRVIRRAGLLDCERRGKWLFYRVTSRHRPLLRAWFRHFQATDRTVPVLARDARKARAQIARRKVLRCPAPRFPGLRPRHSEV